MEKYGNKKYDSHQGYTSVQTSMNTSTGKENGHEINGNELNLQPILNKLDNIAGQFDKYFLDLKGAIRLVTVDSDCEKSIKELWNNNHGLNDIFNSIAEIKKSLTNVLDPKFKFTESQVNQILQVGSNFERLVQTINNKIDKLKEEFEPLSKKVSNGNSNAARFNVEKEHKTYFTWTAVFAIALVLSAIFITRGYLVVFSAPAYLTSVLIIFCISLGVTCIFNLVFSIKSINLYTEDKIRLTYFVVCGVLVGGTFLLSILVLVI